MGTSEWDVDRYPLEWPLGWTRTPPGRRRRALFGTRVEVAAGAGTWYQKRALSVGEGTARLTGELRRLGATAVIISSNMRVRQDGLPYASQARVLEDPGVAVYFKLRGKPLVLACDRWSSVADNMAAIAGHVEAVRASDRYGVGSLEQAFAGYKALPADTAANWRAVLGFDQDARVTRDQVVEAFRALAREKHPDVGGDEGAFAHLTRARDYALEELT